MEIVNEITNKSSPLPVIWTPDVEAAVSKARSTVGLEAAAGERRLKLMSVSDVVKPGPPTPYLVKRYFGYESLCYLSSPPGAGKSAVCLGLAASVASGLQWAGQRTMQGAVAYFAGEGYSGIRYRLALWLQEHPSVDDPAGMKMYISERGGNIDTPEGLNEIHAAIQETRTVPRMIVIDTQSRWQTGDESSTQDAAAFVRALDELKTTYHACVLVVHHCGKATNGLRGSSVYRAAADTEYEIKSKEIEGHKYLQMSCTKIKDGETPMPLWFALEGRRLEGWYDCDNDPITSVIAEHCDPPEEGARPGRPCRKTETETLLRVVDENAESSRNEVEGAIAQVFSVSPSTAKRRINDLIATGQIEPKPQPCGKTLLEVVRA